MADFDDRDAFENSYYYFVEALSVLAAPAEQACEMLGHFNVAFEAKYDAEAGPHLFNYKSCPLSENHKKEIEELINLLRSVPDDVLAFTSSPSESLEKMSQSCWVNIRHKAASLLDSLSPITEQNKRYFNV